MMKHASLGSLTFERARFKEMECMITSIFPASVITKKKDDLFFRAGLLNKAIGFIHLGKRKGIWTVIGIGVVPEFRTKGYGTEILKFGIETVRNMLGHSIALKVNEDNHEAMGVYSKFGFRKIGKSGKRIMMILALNS